MGILAKISDPADIKKLSLLEMRSLAQEIRRFLITNVARTGGHLGPNLGVVELSIALHRVFDSPADKLIFDTGHQAYVHKLLTGRRDFTQLRQAGGISGYPSRRESVHDIVENSHASTSLSWADGISRGMQLQGDDHCVVAVIGDGAMTGGMSWEALNNIAEDSNRRLIIVLNDNGRSYAPTIGGMVRRIDSFKKIDEFRISKEYEDLLERIKSNLKKSGLPGNLVYDTLRGLKQGVKGALVDAGIFDSLGLKYIGPIDGHNLENLLEAFQMAKDYGGPVVVHAITEKGRGYKPAEENKADHFHAVGRIHPETGLPIVESRFGWTSVFSEEMLQLARENPKLIGVTAAMLLPVGLGPMQQEFPERIIDVGIAEQHGMTMSAGLAKAGMHPVFALYATFMNRAFDQLLMDVALHNEAVTICLDRSGITGDDGPSHNGMWDLSLAAMIPGLQVGVPRDGERLRELLRQAVQISSPTLLRYPKGPVPPDIPAIAKRGSLDVLFSRTLPGEKPLLVMGVGAFSALAVQGSQLADTGTLVVDPRWILPIAEDLLQLAEEVAGFVVLEDGLVDGGVGSELQIALQKRGIMRPVRALGINKEFIMQGKRADILAAENLTPAGVAQEITNFAEGIKDKE
ncbi:1-deoxy-D-xylulose-5-phosphate synthase [uncultured Arcanobacterium sp.]|uniref:1-deoxy-D-xylulose-5-phosphate synthase n=1 Tax=uncultured Arcanobacterium sp. TaxID=487520 RepID=UPI002612BCE8|nr:1-deoxy-D-xylulose-5-phosphate synthase [uncultured Arcanobacterium sp.]